MGQWPWEWAGGGEEGGAPSYWTKFGYFSRIFFFLLMYIHVYKYIYLVTTVVSQCVSLTSSSHMAMNVSADHGTCEAAS